jgi:hypothetical protein
VISFLLLSVLNLSPSRLDALLSALCSLTHLPSFLCQQAASYSNATLQHPSPPSATQHHEPDRCRGNSARRPTRNNSGTSKGAPVPIVELVHATSPSQGLVVLQVSSRATPPEEGSKDRSSTSQFYKPPARYRHSFDFCFLRADKQTS